MLDCYVYRQPNLTVGEMLEETNRWQECLRSLIEAIDFLLEGSEQHGRE